MTKGPRHICTFKTFKIEPNVYLYKRCDVWITKIASAILLISYTTTTKGRTPEGQKPIQAGNHTNS